MAINTVLYAINYDLLAITTTLYAIKYGLVAINAIHLPLLILGKKIGTPVIEVPIKKGIWN